MSRLSGVCAVVPFKLEELIQSSPLVVSQVTLTPLPDRTVSFRRELLTQTVLMISRHQHHLDFQRSSGGFLHLMRSPIRQERLLDP